MSYSAMKGGGSCGAEQFACMDDDTGESVSCHATMDEAKAAAEAKNADGEAAAAAEMSVLPETWTGPIARSVLTDDGRDFSATVWTWRDPAVSRLPLMWQTETNQGHLSALLAGYVTELSLDPDGTVMASGQFFDSPEGQAFRDVLKAAGRWGVSVDPGKLDYEDMCLEEDEEGFCLQGQTAFHAYEVIGVTGTPFPAFADAYIELTGAAVEDEGDSAAVGLAPVAASALARPPSRFFKNPNFDAPAPLQIEDDGRVYGHVATFDQCHTGWNNQCITAPDAIATQLFHTGQVMTAEGQSYATGPLVMGTDHPGLDPYLTLGSVIDHYAHTGCAWADVRLGTDEWGIWCAGAIRPGVTDDQIRVLRASALSGDWRTVDGKLQLCAVLTVSTPGFPIPRALAASGKAYPRTAERSMRARLVQGEPVAAVGLGAVRCPECRKRALANVVGEAGPEPAVLNINGLEEVLALLRALEVRTRPLKAQQRSELLARIRG